MTDEFAYQPYGRLIAHSGTTQTPFSWLGSYGVWDAGHGLYLLRYRAYDANLARFGQVDPAGLDGGFNLYVYAGSDPINNVDSLGLWANNNVWNGASAVGHHLPLHPPRGLVRTAFRPSA